MFCNISSSLTEEEEYLYKEVRFWANGVFGGCLGIIGFIMNTLTLIILRSMPEWKHMMNYLLSMLLLVNNMYLITQIINMLAYGLPEYGLDVLMVIVPNFVYPIEETVLTMGVFFTVSIAHQAYLLTWEYEEYDMMSSSQAMLRKHTLAYAVPISIVSVVINLPRWFSYKLETIENDIYEIIEYKMVETDMEKNFYYRIYYENFVLNVLTVFVPITLLVFFNWSVFNFIKKKQHEIDSTLKNSMYEKNEDNKEKKVHERSKPEANILIIIIILFITCHFPRCILKFADGYPKDLTTRILDMLGRVLLIAYASATPFIYLTKNNRFRKQFYLLFNRICYCRRVSSYETNAFANIKIQNWEYPKSKSGTNRTDRTESSV